MTKVQVKTVFPHRHLLGIEGLSRPDIETLLDMAEQDVELSRRVEKKRSDLRGQRLRRGERLAVGEDRQLPRRDARGFHELHGAGHGSAQVTGAGTYTVTSATQGNGSCALTCHTHIHTNVVDSWLNRSPLG